MRCDAEAVVLGLYAAWNLQDVEATLAYCHDDIVYSVHLPPEATWPGGTMYGKDAVRGYLKSIATTWAFVRLTPGPFDIRGNDVREYMQFKTRHRATNQLLDGHKRHIWTVIDGRIAKCEEFQDAAAVKAFLQMVAAG